jgi:hypothetical protein
MVTQMDEAVDYLPIKPVSTIYSIFADPPLSNRLGLIVIKDFLDLKK